MSLINLKKKVIKIRDKMPDHLVTGDKLSAVEEETDMYEAFAPHVETSQITILQDTPPGKF